MISSPSPPRSTIPAWHQGFLSLLPAIRLHASVSFRQLNPDARAEAIQNCLSNAMVAYVRLFELGKVELAYAGPLARYAVAQTRSGRIVGTPLNVKDVSSPYAQAEKGFVLARLDHYDKDEGWRELVVEDRHAGPAEVAVTRLDFRAFLRTLPRRLRRIAKVLAMGETTTAAAKKFGVSQGRISQMRKELLLAWQNFQGEIAVPA
jgi:hypothetical protein